MPEIGGPSIEIAHKLNEEKKHTAPHPSRSVEILEIVEAIVLALVAVTTAWSGYQAANGMAARMNSTSSPPNSASKPRDCRLRAARSACTMRPP